tara:strand:- start:4162 stop:5406 length:1245 start_codon:yes stop_codon:yes gene_type:complete
MGYVGNQTTTSFTSMDKQTITGTGASTYTLSHNVSSESEIEVFVNNIRQEGGSGKAYTVSDNQITFSENINSTDDCYVIFQGKAIQTVVPPDGSVTSAKLANAFPSASLDMNGTELILDSDGDTSITSDTDDRVDIKVGGSDKVHITSTGLGIGTSSPETIIHATTSSAIVRLTSATNGTSGVDFGDSDDTNIGRILYDNSDNSMRFTTNTSERMKITSDGLTILGSGAINTTSTTVGGRGSRFAINQGNASGFAIAIDNIRNETSASGGILITNNETSGTFDALSFLNSSNQEIGKINTSNGSTSYSTSSDYRLKENVTYDFDATTRLKQLKPSRFNFIADKDTTIDGFLAHEVFSIVPEAISGEKDAVDKDGNIDPQGIDQSKLVPLLTKALQEAVAKIETLEAKVTALEGK